jgi:Mn-dependent DtxR family transcriptional regulator
MAMRDWSFLTNHARTILFIANNPQARLRDLASALDLTERTAYAIVVDLTEAGYVVKERDGRRNSYHIQKDLPLRDTVSRQRTIGELLDLLGSSATAAGAPARRGRAVGTALPTKRASTLHRRPARV